MTLIMGDATQKKRDRDDSEEDFELASPEAKRLRDDLLGFIDDSDPLTATPDLDLFMRSFQEEIYASPVVVMDLIEKPAESQMDLGYLLEASDDELGLPPPPPPSTDEEKPEEEEEKKTAGLCSGSDDIAIGEMWRFDEQMISSYDEFGIVGEGSSYNCEYVELDGLFDYSYS